MNILPYSLVYCCFLHLGPGRGGRICCSSRCFSHSLPLLMRAIPTSALAGGKSSSAMAQQPLNSTLLKRRREANGDRRKALMLKIGCHSCVAPGDNAKIMTNTGEDHCRAIRLQARADVRSYFGGAGRSQSV